jgi:hypothetical protein
LLTCLCAGQDASVQQRTSEPGLRASRHRRPTVAKSGTLFVPPIKRLRFSRSAIHAWGLYAEVQR